MRTPSAQYQRSSSGEIGAAPETQRVTLFSPIMVRTLDSTSRFASQRSAAISGGTGWLTCAYLAQRSPARSAQLNMTCAGRVASFIRRLTEL